MTPSTPFSCAPWIPPRPCRGAHGARIELEQAPELAFVRREDRRRAARGEGVEAPGVRVEAVGVQDDRDVGARHELAGESERAVAAADAGADDERPAAPGQIEDRLDAGGGVRAVLVG